jgi:hypothetical protein
MIACLSFGSQTSVMHAKSASMPAIAVATAVRRSASVGVNRPWSCVL